MLEITGIFPEARKEKEKKPTCCVLLWGFSSQALPSITWWYRAHHSVGGANGPQEPQFMWRRCEGGARVLGSRESVWLQGRTHVPDKCLVHGALAAGGGDVRCTAAVQLVEGDMRQEALVQLLLSHCHTADHRKAQRVVVLLLKKKKNPLILKWVLSLNRDLWICPDITVFCSICHCKALPWFWDVCVCVCECVCVWMQVREGEKSHCLKLFCQNKLWSIL